MSDEILSQQDGPILRITLNRPDAGNGATDAMAIELTRLLNGAAEKSRLVVLRGAGKDFCIGRATMGQQPAVMPEALVRKRQYDVVFNAYAAIRNTPIPVIGVVQGRALGFGCAVAALCDITIASDASTFQIPEMEHYILPTMVLSAMIDRMTRKGLRRPRASAQSWHRERGGAGRQARRDRRGAVQVHAQSARGRDRGRQGISAPRHDHGRAERGRSRAQPACGRELVERDEAEVASARSPDGAKRNPGAGAPHSAALHAGYSFAAEIASLRSQ